MCGRFTFQPTEDFYERFQIVNRLDGLVARYNIAPGQLVPVVIAQRSTYVDGSRDDVTITPPRRGPSRPYHTDSHRLPPQIP
jgi:putative SOS response-associated peptidase YedK